MHVVEELVLVKVPASQSVHATAPSTTENLPACGPVQGNQGSV